MRSILGTITGIEIEDFFKFLTDLSTKIASFALTQLNMRWDIHSIIPETLANTLYFKTIGLVQRETNCHFTEKSWVCFCVCVILSHMHTISYIYRYCFLSFALFSCNHFWRKKSKITAQWLLSSECAYNKYQTVNESKYTYNINNNMVYFPSPSFDFEDINKREVQFTLTHDNDNRQMVTVSPLRFIKW